MVEFTVQNKGKKNVTISHNGRDVSKSQAALILYRDVAKDESLSTREMNKLVKTALVDDLGMTPKGSNTYVSNAKRVVVDGGDMYVHNKSTNKKARDRKALENASQMADTVNTEVTLPAEVKKPKEVVDLERWRVENKDTKELLSSFTTRTAAQKYNKEHTDNTRWFDGNKAA